MKKYIITMGLFLFMASVSFASTDTIMLVTDIASVDASVAAAAAAKTGVPVLVLQDGKLNDATLSAIADLAPLNIVLVGGPLVVLPEVEAKLNSSNYTVIRLWGMDRTGTAVAVAAHFWPEGSACAVLVADTKNSDLDSARQRIASSFASRFNCTLIPIPEGSLPADVLKTITDLKVSNVWYVGMTAFPKMREMLKQFNYKEIIGDNDYLQNRTDNLTNATKMRKLVIVATPDWKAAVGFAAYPNGRSVVRFISNLDQLPPVIEFIKSNNITNVTVVGIPDLSGKIAERLQAENITVTQISGQKASEISDAVAKKFKLEWEERKMKHDAQQLAKSLKIRARLLDELNDTLNKLQAAEAEALALPDSGDKTDYLNAIHNATAKITEIQALITAGKYDEASDMLSKALKFREFRFLKRHAFGFDINKDIKDEEEDLDNSQQQANSELTEASNVFSQTRAKCQNSTLVDTLINKSRELKDQMDAAKSSGDYQNAAGLAIRAREIASIAIRIGTECASKGALPAIAGEVARARGIIKR